MELSETILMVLSSDNPFWLRMCQDSLKIGQNPSLLVDTPTEMSTIALISS